MTEEFLVSVEKVSKKFCRNLAKSLEYGLGDITRDVLGLPRKKRALRPAEFWAVKDVSFQIRPGDRLALLGRNGAGKSTLLKMMNGKLKLDEGEIRVRGRIAAIYELGAGFNPTQTGRENIYNTAAVYGMSRAQTMELFERIVDFAGIRQAIDSPIGNYSSGMRTRLGYAVAAHLEPDLFILDEVMAAGDILFRQKCYDHLNQYRDMNRSLILATHEFARIQSFCNRCLVMDEGRIVFSGTVNDGVNFYLDALNVPREDELSQQALVKVKERLLVPESGSPAPKGRSMDEVEIESLTVRSGNGNQIDAGSPVEIVLEYQAGKPFEETTWGFMICTAERQTKVATGFAGFAGRKYALPRGKGNLQCKIPSLDLQPGSYCLKGTMIGPAGVTLARFGWREPPYYFDVSGPDRGVKDPKKNAVADLEMHWE
jgi:homopolymeric O-antigen transport system ATP-binding protein